MANDEPTAEANSRRKTWYVSRIIQGRLMSRLIGYWFVYHGVLLGAMFLFHFMQYRGTQLAGLPPRTFLELAAEFGAAHWPLVLSALCVLPLVIWDGVRTTHRVAGPLVRFQNALDALARGERVEPIELRDGDLVIELQDAFNAYLATLDQPAADTFDPVEAFGPDGRPRVDVESETTLPTA